MKKILGVILLSAGIAFGQYSGGGYNGGLGTAGSLTNGQVVIATGANSVGTSGAAPYDPNILINMIGTNSMAIDNRYGNDVVVVEAGSDANVNGTNLINAVESFTSVSNDGTIIVTEGIFNLPEDLVITNCNLKINAPNSKACLPIYRGLGTGLVDTEPIYIPETIITGNVTFAQDTDVLGSCIDGFKIVGDVSAIQTDSTDYLIPPFLINCYVIGDVANGEATSLGLVGTFVDGSYAEGGAYNGDYRQSTVLDSFSFDVPAGTGGQLVNFDTCWVAGTNCFGQKTRAGVPRFVNCEINGINAFRLNPSVAPVKIYNTRFFGTAGSTNLWDGIKDDVQTEIINCFGVHTNIINKTTATVLDSYDWNNVSVE